MSFGVVVHSYHQK